MSMGCPATQRRRHHHCDAKDTRDTGPNCSATLQALGEPNGLSPAKGFKSQRVKVRDPRSSSSLAIGHQNVHRTSGTCGVSDAGDEGTHRQTAKLINGGSRALTMSSSGSRDGFPRARNVI